MLNFCCLRSCFRELLVVGTSSYGLANLEIELHLDVRLVVVVDVYRFLYGFDRVLRWNFE